MTRFGSFTLHAIETGTFWLDGGAMFGVVPRLLWEKRTTPDPQNRIRLAMRCLLIETSDRLILVDNGVGDKVDEKFRHIYAIDQESANLQGSLRKAGFGPDEVTDVILTHLHFDHCGGSTRRVSDRIVPAFPRATYHVQRSHWDWAHHPNPREAASFIRENFDPIEATGQLHFTEGVGELFPGISVMPVNGHTEAQQMVGISGSRGALVFVADLIPTLAHARPTWVMGYDVRPLVSVEEKTSFLHAAAEGRWHLMFEHDPVNVIVSVEPSEKEPHLVHARPMEEL